MEQRRCMGCMQTYAAYDAVCPFCGYIEGTPAKEAYHIKPGSLLHDRYTVGRAIGFGGFGITYIAWDNKLMQKVAIKEYMPSEYATRVPGNLTVTIYDGERYTEFMTGLQKFLDEAQRLAKFQNVPGIVRILDCFSENLTAYIVMEYLDGMTLKQYLAEHGGKLPYEEAVEFILPVLAALQAVHKEGIIHRDISPDNIFITEDGEVKLLDFGAARYASTGYSKSLSVILKPGYAPAEQYLSHGEQGPWSDVYATAATLYRMITGVVPEEALERKEKDTLKPPSALGAKLPKNAEKAILNALNVRVENRTASAEEFEAQLLSTANVIRVTEKGEKRFTIRMPTGMKVLLISTLVLALTAEGLFSAGVLKLGLGNRIVFNTSLFDSAETNAPGVINMTLEEGQAAAEDCGLTLSVRNTVASADVPQGTIVTQTPQPGKKIRKNAALSVDVSGGPSYELIPDIVDTVWADSERQIEDAGFVPKVFYEYSDSVPEGVVASLGREVRSIFPKGEKLKVVVSKGAEHSLTVVPVAMPDISGMLYNEAKARLNAVGLGVLRKGDAYSDTTPKGTILQQSVETGTMLQTGDVVTLSVCLGTKQVVVPSLQYMPEGEAADLLANLGLTYTTTEEEDDTVKSGFVLRQTLESNKVVPTGTVVPIVVSLGKCEDMPATSGEKLSRVKTEMEILGFSNVSYVGEYSADVAKDVVISQSISAGERINVETAIIIKYSWGKQPWPMAMNLSRGSIDGDFAGARITGGVCDVVGGNLQVTLYYEVDEEFSGTSYGWSCFSPPNGEQFMRSSIDQGSPLNNSDTSMTFTISGQAIKSSTDMTVKLWINRNSGAERSVFWSVTNFAGIRDALTKSTS